MSDSHTTQAPEEGAWPWCEACRSWHHPDNPTCFKLTRPANLPPPTGAIGKTCPTCDTEILESELEHLDWTDSTPYHSNPDVCVARVRAAMRGAFLEEMECRFPWLRSDDEPAEGADTIMALCDWHDELTADPEEAD